MLTHDANFLNPRTACQKLPNNPLNFLYYHGSKRQLKQRNGQPNRPLRSNDNVPVGQDDPRQKSSFRESTRANVYT